MPTQQISPSPTRYNVASLATIGITPDELGRPTPWSRLVRTSPAADLQYTARLLDDVDQSSTRNFLAGLAYGELCFVADFLNSLAVPFSFAAWDHERTDVVERGGPDRQSVLALLDHHQHQPVVDLNNDRLDRIWQAVSMLLDELRKRTTVSFALVWESGRMNVPELDYHGHNREIAWRALWQTLPFEDRHHVSRKPPPPPMDLDAPRLDVAPPSRTEPDPGNCHRIVWPKFQEFNFDRQLDWRWNRAFALVIHGRYISRRRDDPQTAQAVRFLREAAHGPGRSTN